MSEVRVDVVVPIEKRPKDLLGAVLRYSGPVDSFERVVTRAYTLRRFPVTGKKRVRLVSDEQINGKKP